MTLENVCQILKFYKKIVRIQLIDRSNKNGIHFEFVDPEIIIPRLKANLLVH